jgi:hypothetical protein
MEPIPKYPCPCCGYQTYGEAAGGSMQICPVCFWGDAPGEAPWNNSNEATIVEAQRNFHNSGACESRYLYSVRPATADEARSEEWLPFDGQAEALIRLIEAAYDGVGLGDGITIHQREAIGDYASSEEIEAARFMDTEARWQDIPDEKMDELGTTLTFLDPESIRYHLPAFMCFVLRLWLKSDSVGGGDMVLYSLSSGPKSEGYHAESFTLLDLKQKQATAAFLGFITTVDLIYGSDAGKALRKGWAAFLPDGSVINQ